MIGEVETSATIETGTVVVETSGYFKNCEFVMLENGKGLHDKFGVRALIAPVRKAVFGAAPKRPTLAESREALMLKMLRAATDQTVLNIDFIAAGDAEFGRPWHRFSVTVQSLREKGFNIEDHQVPGSTLHETRLVESIPA